MNKLDESNDNKLDELEVYSTLHKLKKKHGLDEDFDQKKVSDLFKKFDKDNSNNLDFGEAKELVKYVY